MQIPFSFLSGVFLFFAWFAFIVSAFHIGVRTEEGKEIYRFSSHSAVFLVLVAIFLKISAFSVLLEK